MPVAGGRSEAEGNLRNVMSGRRFIAILDVLTLLKNTIRSPAQDGFILSALSATRWNGGRARRIRTKGDVSERHVRTFRLRVPLTRRDDLSISKLFKSKELHRHPAGHGSCPRGGIRSHWYAVVPIIFSSTRGTI